MTYETATIGNCTLYRGDCLDVLKHVGQADAIITDPVWPGNTVKEFEGINTAYLFKRTICSTDFYVAPKRSAIIVNCDTNPTFIFSTICRLPFFRIMWLRYEIPGHKGRLMNSANVAYLFGEPPKSRKGNHCIGGECSAPGLKVDKHGHPCPRRIEHMNFVVDKWSSPGETIIDPFMGSGTTGVACVNTGRKFIGIEIVPEYFDIACRRIEKALKDAEAMFPEVRPSVQRKFPKHLTKPAGVPAK